MTNERTSRGNPVTEEQIEAMAREAEVGYDVGRLRRAGGRKPMGTAAARVVPVRLEPELDDALRARALSQHRTVSEVIREALRASLDVRASSGAEPWKFVIFKVASGEYAFNLEDRSGRTIATGSPHTSKASVMADVQALRNAVSASQVVAP